MLLPSPALVDILLPQPHGIFLKCWHNERDFSRRYCRYLDKPNILIVQVKAAVKKVEAKVKKATTVCIVPWPILILNMWLTM